MLRGESHVSHSQILLLCNSTYHMSRFAERLQKSKKMKQYNSSLCELGPPVIKRASSIFEISIHYRILETTSGFKFQIISSLMQSWDLEGYASLSLTVTKIVVASWHRIQNKLWPDVPLGVYADFTLHWHLIFVVSPVMQELMMFINGRVTDV